MWEAPKCQLIKKQEKTVKFSHIPGLYFPFRKKPNSFHWSENTRDLLNPDCVKLSPFVWVSKSFSWTALRKHVIVLKRGGIVPWENMFSVKRAEVKWSGGGHTCNHEDALQSLQRPSDQTRAFQTKAFPWGWPRFPKRVTQGRAGTNNRTLCTLHVCQFLPEISPVI